MRSELKVQKTFQSLPPGEVRRRVEQRPGAERRPGDRAQLTEPALPEADDEDAAQQEERIELGGRPEPDEQRP